ncbi:FadR/GntR family transcriptional regulator [Planomicrobium sp. YIM 101495]|uniref:FadR/GntR family transcriptional regulator n=1 Tax=Planomicrobium sp. YIM 101495 TaxID=2665160 RepID=UPI0012B7D6BC|nr:FadR/GntR family transcriptional regulator [Planomicrobium sp. YIM 101495]MTD30761.1 FCD domain-containing protein [Planomicrobium sp. YIM 101495]
MYKLPSRNLIYQDVLNQIITLIKNGEWVAGDRIPTETELAKVFQVSRNSIREALKILEHLNIISSKAGSGTHVLEESHQNIQKMEFINILRQNSTYESLMDTRLIIEPELTYRAALNATEKDIKNLEIIIETSIDQIKNGTYYTPTVGFSFHMELAKIANNEILWKFLESITLELLGLRKVIMDNHDLQDLLGEIEEHKTIFGFIKSASAEEAKKAMYHHLKNAQSHLTESKK